MPDVSITQQEAQALIDMLKIRLDENTIYEYPPLGGSISIPLTSLDKRENFLLDISRNSINLQKGKYQNRARTVIILTRLDFGGPDHLNPDMQVVPCPHLHIYRQGFGDKWAYPIPLDEFSNINDLSQTLQDFMRFCNIVEPPLIRLGLFV